MSTLNCTQTRALLMAWLDSELDAVTTVEIGEHLSVCTVCRQRFEAEAALETGLRERLQDERMPPEVWERLQAALADEAGLEFDDEPAPVLRRRTPWIPLVAAALVLVAATLVLLQGEGELQTAGELRQQLLHGFLTAHASSESHFVPGAEAVPVALGEVGLPDFELPRTGLVEGHDVVLLGASTFAVDGHPCAELRYECCGELVSVFVLEGGPFADTYAAGATESASEPELLEQGGVWARATRQDELLLGVVSRHRSALTIF